MRVLLIVAGLVVGGLAGFFVGQAGADPETGNPVNDGTRAEVPRSEPEPGPDWKALNDAAEAKARQLAAELAQAKDALAAAETREAALTKDLQAAHAEAVEVAKPEAVAVGDVMAKIESLRANGMNAFLAPGATSALVADLRALGKEGVDLLRGLLTSESPDDRFLAAKLLEELGDPQAIGDLLKATLDDDTERVRNMASHALALMGGKDAVDALRQIVERGAEGPKVNALFGLTKAGNEWGVQQSLAYLQDPEQPNGMKNALVGGLLVLNNPAVMPHAGFAETRFRESEQGMGMIVGYYQRINTPASRARLQAIANDPGLAQAIRDAATQALAQ